MQRLLLPPLYVIADQTALRAHRIPLRDFAGALRSAGVTLIQLRNKHGAPEAVLAEAVVLRALFPPAETLLVMNDHPDLARQAGFDGVHLGQHDLSPQEARLVLEPQSTFVGAPKLIGLSTHTLDQVLSADASAADYIAIGPIFPTATKSDAAPVVGLDLLRRARALTSRPLVAIGGITRANVRSVFDAGADSVAVISALFAPHETPEKVARDFLDFLR